MRFSHGFVQRVVVTQHGIVSARSFVARRLLTVRKVAAVVCWLPTPLLPIKVHRVTQLKVYLWPVNYVTSQRVSSQVRLIGLVEMDAGAIFKLTIIIGSCGLEALCGTLEEALDTLQALLDNALASRELAVAKLQLILVHKILLHGIFAFFYC